MNTITWVFCYWVFGLDAPQAQLKLLDPELQPLTVKSLVLGVEIENDLALTRYDLAYFNPNDVDVEARLDFPLPGEALIQRFAMEVEGVLREGVVVDAAEGRRAYEDIVNLKVDPGLVEMVQGRTFRADVYPAPALGTKRLVIEILDQLPRDGRAWVYRLPVLLQESNCIAPELFRNASPLVLDEATISLDAGTENLIRDTLKRLRGKTHHCPDHSAWRACPGCRSNSHPRKGPHR